jgi:hypothetical protein
MAHHISPSESWFFFASKILAIFHMVKEKALLCSKWARHRITRLVKGAVAGNDTFAIQYS